MKKKIIIPTIITLGIIAVSIVYRGVILVGELSRYAGLETEHITQLVYEALNTVVLVIAILGIVLYFYLSHIIKEVTEPVALLTRQAKEASRGIYKHSVRHYELEEIQQLANAFDYMGERVHRTIRKLNYQRSKAETVLSHLEQGIIILDQEGYVTEINEVGKQMLGVSYNKRDNLHVADINRDAAWQQFTLSIIKDTKTTPAQLTIGEHLMYLSGRVIRRESSVLGYIISVKDITDIRKLEELRYQFVSNVTHELKTPLTSIQGFVETLQDGALENPDMAKRFLGIIEVEAKRLNQLIQDILALSEIENSTRISSESIEIGPVVEEVIRSVNIIASKKNITINYTPKENFVIKDAEKEQIKQIVINLVSNAVRYTDEGFINIGTYMEGEKKVLRVEDSGIGIPKENIERIFERFYRVDKSRSRQSGGTGLGLSIVKHLVKLYGGEITVDSEVGKGTVFTVKL